MKSKHMKKRCSYNDTYPFNCINLFCLFSSSPNSSTYGVRDNDIQETSGFQPGACQSLGAPDRLRLASGGTAAYVPDGPYIRLLR